MVNKNTLFVNSTGKTKNYIMTLFNFSEVKTGYFHTCAKGMKYNTEKEIYEETIFCWGSHVNGKLGSGSLTNNDQASPTEIKSVAYSN